MSRRRASTQETRGEKMSCLSFPTVYHAAVVIFLEFFAFGLLTTPMISVLDEAFPKHTFLMNGIIQGVKGFLSFLSAPLIGALSDGIGRKPFLLLTVTFTCSPIPLMKISHWWYFTMISISGVFSVTFSVVLAYVADITTEEDRSWAYGLVSATFAASLVTSPAIGAYLGRVFSEDLVIALATAIAFLDILFILACVPESLPEKVRSAHAVSPVSRAASNGSNNCGQLSWDKIDPFAALRKVTTDHLVLIICITTFLSYLPEAGQYSCFFVYLRLVMGFTEESVALFIAVGGILACISQTVVLSVLNSYIGPKRAIITGLVFEAIQLTLYGFATHHALLWIAGSIAAMGSITYPALSAFVSKHAAVDQQGVAQGLVTGIRGLCGGLGPALFGLIFYLCRVDLNTQTPSASATSTLSGGAVITSGSHYLQLAQDQSLPGAPFAFGAVLVLLAIFVALFIPENPKSSMISLAPTALPGNRGSVAHNPFGNFPGNRLRRLSESADRVRLLPFELNEMSDVGGIDSTTNQQHAALLQSTHITKDHFISEIQPGFLDRWLFGRVGSRHRSRRSNRFFRQPTVSFSRAHFVEPLRRLLTGFSVNRSTPTHLVEVRANASGDADRVGLFDSEIAAESSWYEDTDAADLSNYRSHNLKHLLNTPSSLNPPLFNKQLSEGTYRYGSSFTGHPTEHPSNDRITGGNANTADVSVENLRFTATP